MGNSKLQRLIAVIFLNGAVHHSIMDDTKALYSRRDDVFFHFITKKVAARTLGLARIVGFPRV